MRGAGLLEKGFSGVILKLSLWVVGVAAAAGGVVVAVHYRLYFS